MSAAEKVEERPIYHRWSSADVIHDQAEELQRLDPTLCDSDAWDQASRDDFIHEEAWDFLLDDLQVKLDEYNPDGLDWCVRVENFGWRNLGGEKVFGARDSQRFLQSILPDTDCTFNIYVDDETKTIQIRNWHHDSPMGNEWYTITVHEGDDE